MGLILVSVQRAMMALFIRFFVDAPILRQTIKPIRSSAVATATAPSPMPMARMFSALIALALTAASIESLNEFRSGWSSWVIQLLLR